MRDFKGRPRLGDTFGACPVCDTQWATGTAAPPFSRIFLLDRLGPGPRPDTEPRWECPDCGTQWNRKGEYLGHRSDVEAWT